MRKEQRQFNDPATGFFLSGLLMSPGFPNNPPAQEPLDKTILSIFLKRGRGEKIGGVFKWVITKPSPRRLPLFGFTDDRRPTTQIGGGGASALVRFQAVLVRWSPPTTQIGGGSHRWSLAGSSRRRFDSALRYGTLRFDSSGPPLQSFIVPSIGVAVRNIGEGYSVVTTPPLPPIAEVQPLKRKQTISTVIHVCNKKKFYSTKARGKQAADSVKRSRGRKMRAYHCPNCRGYHLTTIKEGGFAWAAPTILVNKKN